MTWNKAYQLLCMFFLRYEQLFTDWNTLVLLNINRAYDSCPGTTHLSLIVCDWICSIIIKITMEPGPWTLITYSAYVLISWTTAMWYSLYGMRCNSKPLSIICLVFTQASTTLISSVLCCGQTTVGFWICSESPSLHMASASSLLAPLHWKSLRSKRAGVHEHIL